jgi:UDP-2,3-diacylglucosamine pyrophosphatase LpxH
VKSAVSYVSDFEKELVNLAKSKKCNGVICGHIHHPENCYYDGIHYLNSGDWVETLSALTEDENGNWEVKYFDRADYRVTAFQEELAVVDKLITIAS